ncbi:MAG: aminoacyl-tRNA hydrolase [Candidatus Komeilibacteria bacterium RIFCSPLOWO2_01_FULL_52_15]|uniref:Peptidyl-tRNA hydrolase n=2 Tax=Candidatus Komeiliibacteriota TaxID=1817908 RepID=A0A1G2BP38_9BACT|nr:MAG: aminoacyl-tRNA hydrolase [Candidatus Komeilibacteria bacterium RIFCSPHIGHO2_01_FULL_52_14]OGY90892.1 MAG: aminoacyl-tRNA hydrolase [Candidatus Komeilibacteria bacterium RIFCSPLOWO2_01_FULL_52_15]
MKLIIGLGNPGAKYKDTRHNFGARAVELLAKKLEANFKMSKKLNARVAAAKLDGADMLVALPQSFMNESGMPVSSLFHYYKVGSEDLIVVYDEIDLPFGTVRVGNFTSSGGHKGVQSIIDTLGTPAFARVRLGIGPQTGPAENYVLEKWSPDQHEKLPELLDRATDAIKELVQNGPEKAASKFN